MTAALVVNKHLLNTDHLHFGYWPDDLEVTLANLPEAQRLHSELIIGHVPEGVKRILDVGCGSGRLAWELTQRGYAVDCVAPSKVLCAHAAELLGDKSQVHECRLQDLQTDRQYDLVLFSESFQYVPIRDALGGALDLLDSSGHVLLCDFFKLPKTGSPLRGGHALGEFYDQVEKLPLEIRLDKDVTKETARSLDLTNDLLGKIVKPIWEAFRAAVKTARPRLSRFLFWLFRKKIAKLEWKYTSGARTGASFIEFKSYRLIHLERVAEKSDEA